MHAHATHPHAARPGSRRRGPPPVPDFDRAPFLMIWEVTRACALACKHCRAEAMDLRDPRELSTEEGIDLLQQTAAMGTPLAVLTGGDPLQREDLEDLIRAGVAAGLRVATIPAATPRLTPERLRSLKEAGVAQLAFSIDAPTEEAHDAFRGVPGSFRRTMDAARTVRELGVPLQINSVFGPWNLGEVENTANLVRSLGAAFWEVFLLVPTGRGKEAGALSPEDCEQLFADLYAEARRSDFVLKVAEAPHYRRYVIEQLLGDKAVKDASAQATHLLQRPVGPQRSIGHSPRSVNAGKGFCFVDHHGDVQPSGFLPMTAANVREVPLADIYRDDELFKNLRDPAKLLGRCGRCEFREVCGGSRSRAHALTGSPLAADPWCGYHPGQLSLEEVRAVSRGPARPGPAA